MHSIVEFVKKMSNFQVEGPTNRPRSGREKQESSRFARQSTFKILEPTMLKHIPVYTKKAQPAMIQFFLKLIEAPAVSQASQADAQCAISLIVNQSTTLYQRQRVLTSWDACLMRKLTYFLESVRGSECPAKACCEDAECEIDAKC